MLLEQWAWLGLGAFLVWPNVYVLLASILPLAVTLPVTDSVVEGYRVAITPEQMLGRVESVRTSISLFAAPLGAFAAALAFAFGESRQPARSRRDGSGLAGARTAADIPCSLLSRGGLEMGPGGCFVVAGVGLEAAVQDADEAVAELAEGGLVADAAFAQGVVVGAGAR